MPKSCCACWVPLSLLEGEVPIPASAGEEGMVPQAGSSPCCEEQSPAGKWLMEEFTSGQERQWLRQRRSTVLGLSRPVQQGEVVRGAQEMPHGKGWFFP